MAVTQPGERYTTLTGADLRGKRYHVVKLDTSQNVILSSAGTDVHFGVLDYNPRTASDAVDVVMVNGVGTFKVKTAANLAAGVLITANSAGQAVAAVTGDRAFGRTLRASVSGEVAEYQKQNLVVV